MSYNNDSSGSSRSSPTEWDILDSSSSSGSNNEGGAFARTGRSPSPHPFEWTYTNLGFAQGSSIKREWSPELSFASRMAGVHFHSPSPSSHHLHASGEGGHVDHDQEHSVDPSAAVEDVSLGSDFWNTAPSTAVNSPARTRLPTSHHQQHLSAAGPATATSLERMHLDEDHVMHAAAYGSAPSPAPACVDPAMTTTRLPTPPMGLPSPADPLSMPVNLDLVNRGIDPNLTASSIKPEPVEHRPILPARADSSLSSRSASSSHHRRAASPHAKPLATQSLVAKEPVIISRTIASTASPAPAQLPSAHLLVCGVPLSGAKSRVETQVKISLGLVRPRHPNCASALGPLRPDQLMDADGELLPEMDREYERVTTWNHIQLPSHLALKKKNAKKQKPDPATEDVLKLDVSVIKASEPDEAVQICAGCRQREVKRAQRKKDSKSRASENGTNDEQEVLDEALENEKVVVFNATEFVEFDGGQVVLPTRITCYCRHHKERIGFIVAFSLSTSDGRVIAQATSPPIMITDDHKMTTGKSSTQATRARYQDQTDGDPDFESGDSRRRRSVASRARRPSRKAKQTYDDSEEESQELPLRQVAAQNGKKQQAKPYDQDNRPRKRPSGVHRSPGFAMTPLSMSKAGSPLLRPQQLDTSSGLPSPSSSMGLSSRRSSQDESFSSSLGLGGLTGASPIDRQAGWIHESSPPTPGSAITDPLSNSLFGSLSSPDMTSALSSANPSVLASPQAACVNPGATTAQAAQDAGAMTGLPKISRLIPGEGPIHGGIEVTILGENFVRGLVCVFGDSPAVPTHFWSANTLVCVLPPSANPGPVVVGIKDVPLTMGEGSQLQLFTYKDNSDRSLLELALQVVGLKMTGKLEDASAVAMRIVGNSPPNGAATAPLPTSAPQQFSASTASLVAGVNTALATPSGSVPSSRRSSVSEASAPSSAPLPYTSNDQTRSFEGTIVKFLSLLDLDAADIPGAAPSIPLSIDPISHTNERKHTLLHLATVLGFHRLTQFLIARGINVNARDRNGYTAVHFAALYGRVAIARQLVEAGADCTIKTRARKTAIDIARDRDDFDVEEILRRAVHSQGSSALSTARPSPTPLTNEALQAAGASGLYTPAASGDEADYDEPAPVRTFEQARSRNASMVSLRYLLDAEADVDAEYDPYSDYEGYDYSSSSDSSEDDSDAEDLDDETEHVSPTGVNETEQSAAISSAGAAGPTSPTWISQTLGRPARRFSQSKLWERVQANVATMPRLSPRSWRSDCTESDAETVVPPSTTSRWWHSSPASSSSSARSPPSIARSDALSPPPPSYTTDDEFDALTTDEKALLDRTGGFARSYPTATSSGLRTHAGTMTKRRTNTRASMRLRDEWTIEEEHVPLRSALRNDKMLAFFWLPILIFVLSYCSWLCYATWPATREYAYQFVAFA